MIVFNELRIDSEKNLIIDASVLDITDDPNGYIHIDHVYVGVGSNQDIVDLDLTNESYVTRRDYSNNRYLRGIRIVLDITNSATQTILNREGVDLTKFLYYIQVTVDTTNPVVELSNCTINTKIEGYTYYKCLLLNKVFDYIKSTDGICNNIDDYVNYIVKINGLQLAVELGNFTLANTYWNKFFANNNNNIGLISNTGCRCHR